MAFSGTATPNRAPTCCRRCGGSINLTANRTIQSFMINDNSGGPTINGNAGVQLTISSGLSFGRVENNQTLTYSVPFLTFGNPTTGYEGIMYNQGVRNDLGGGTVINSVIRDNGANPVSLTIAGHGHTILGGANTYSGPTTVIGGKRVLNVGDDRLPVGTAVDVHTGALLDLNGRSQAVAGLAGAGLITNAAAGLATLTVNAATDQVFEGSLAGALNLVKNGAATLALTNAAVNCGGSLTVNEGTVYLGAATFSNITVKAGATLRCLSGSRINATNATFESGDTLYVALAGTNATDCTQFVVSVVVNFVVNFVDNVNDNDWVAGRARLGTRISLKLNRKLKRRCCRIPDHNRNPKMLPSAATPVANRLHRLFFPRLTKTREACYFDLHEFKRNSLNPPWTAPAAARRPAGSEPPAPPPVPLGTAKRCERVRVKPQTGDKP